MRLSAYPCRRGDAPPAAQSPFAVAAIQSLDRRGLLSAGNSPACSMLCAGLASSFSDTGLSFTTYRCGVWLWHFAFPGARPDLSRYLAETGLFPFYFYFWFGAILAGVIALDMLLRLLWDGYVLVKQGAVPATINSWLWTASRICLAVVGGWTR